MTETAAPEKPKEPEQVCWLCNGLGISRKKVGAFTVQARCDVCKGSGTTRVKEAP